MNIIVGGKDYPLASLKLADVRDLGKAGVITKLGKMSELEQWEVQDMTAEIVACAARRAGASVQARDLLEAADALDLPAFLAATTEVLAASGFAGKAESPNVGSPEVAT